MSNDALRHAGTRASLRMALMAMVCLNLCGCAVMALTRDPDSLKKRSPDSAMLLMSTSSEYMTAFASTALRIFKIDDNGKQHRIAHLPMNSPFFAGDLPENNTRVRWGAVEPGNYVVKLWASNPYLLNFRSPEIFFTVGPSQMVYLGDFRLEADRVSVLSHLGRDLNAFREHVPGAERIAFERVPMQVCPAGANCRRNPERLSPVELLDR